MKIERTRKKGELFLELTPLIDVVFLLLIFFLVATSFTKFEKSGIEIELPQSTIQEVSDIKEIQILIDKNKNIYLNFNDNGKKESKKIAKDSLVEELEKKLELTKDKNVIISGDKSLEYGYIVEIMTISKEAGALSLDIDTANKK